MPRIRQSSAKSEPSVAGIALVEPGASISTVGSKLDIDWEGGTFTLTGALEYPSRLSEKGYIHLAPSGSQRLRVKTPDGHMRECLVSQMVMIDATQFLVGDEGDAWMDKIAEWGEKKKNKTALTSSEKKEQSTLLSAIAGLLNIG